MLPPGHCWRMFPLRMIVTWLVPLGEEGVEVELPLKEVQVEQGVEEDHSNSWVVEVGHP